jgi:hypothetical protein
MIHLFLTRSFVKVIRFMGNDSKKSGGLERGGGQKEGMIIFLDSIR